MVTINEEFSFETFDLVNNDYFEFLKLYINGKCQIDKFLSDIEGNKIFEDELAGIIALMDNMKKDTLYPSTKFNHIEDKKKKDLFEFKSKHLRIYVVKKSPNVYLVIGGYKNTQDKDIANFKKKVRKF